MENEAPMPTERSFAELRQLEQDVGLIDSTRHLARRISLSGAKKALDDAKSLFMFPSGAREALDYLAEIQGNYDMLVGKLDSFPHLRSLSREVIYGNVMSNCSKALNFDN